MTPEALAQREAALQRANEVRVGVAAFKRQIRTMTKAEAAMYLAAALESPTGTLLSANVRVLLMAVPEWGAARAERTLRLERVSMAAHVRDLSERQRCAIARTLRLWGDRWA